MSDKDTRVIIPNVYKGPRHTQCMAAWNYAYEHGEFELEWLFNADESDHYTMLERGWKAAQEGPERFFILTEADFLPNCTIDWVREARFLLGGFQGLGCAHVERVGSTYEAVQSSVNPGAWFLMFDKEKIGAETPNFHYEDQDPAVTLSHQYGLHIIQGRPEFFSMIYPFGCHLFWSRHFNDALFKFKDGRLSFPVTNLGYPLAVILPTIDALLKRWEVVKRC